MYVYMYVWIYYVCMYFMYVLYVLYVCIECLHSMEFGI